MFLEHKRLLPIGIAILATTSLALFAQERLGSFFLNGEPVQVEISETKGKERSYSFGPWKLGARVAEGLPRDGRLNLYVVAPGSDFYSESDSSRSFDHNRVINMRPVKEGPADFDVYWAIVLDPRIRKEFRSEQDILTTAQARFIPGDLYELADSPGGAFLKETMQIDSIQKLRIHRRKDGSLPAVLIVPAGFAVRATVAAP